MNDELLKARSIELAERANRLKDRSEDDETKSKLDNCADELIQIDNELRFDSAQTALERSSGWTEDQRSLAHEINTADESRRSVQPTSYDTALQILAKWSDVYVESSHLEINVVGKNILRALTLLDANDNKGSHKFALNYIIEVLETLLNHLATQDDEYDDKMNRTVLLLRSIRDSILVKRQLVADIPEILEDEINESVQFDRLEAARESLQEIYKNTAPIQVP